MQAPGLDSITLLKWRNTTIRLFPAPKVYYVYLLHFHRKHYRTQHYIGFSGCLESRLKLHRSGSSGVALMRAIKEAGIGFEIAALWQFASWEEAREFERAMKRRKEAPRYCPICQGKQVDALVMMRRGHWPFSLFAKQHPRRPMTTHYPQFLRRDRERKEGLSPKRG